MTQIHDTSYYFDGRVRVEFCRDCGAEGLELLENCPRKIINKNEKSLDVEKQTVK